MSSFWKEAHLILCVCVSIYMKLNPLKSTSIVKEDANIGVRESNAGITCLDSSEPSEKYVTAKTHKEQNT